MTARLSPRPFDGFVESCYTIDITNNSSSEWGTYLFFGGPGGSPC